MILISHRGNINGRKIEKENTEEYILEAINKGYNVEIDVWYFNDKWYLGHNEPEKLIDFNFLLNPKFWIHAKSIDTLYELIKHKELKIFYHYTDNVTLTSNNLLWTFPGKRLTKLSIAVLPENTNYEIDELKNCYGICSDNIQKYKDVI